MAVRRYEISPRVLKKCFTSERSERVKYFSTREEKFRIPRRTWNEHDCEANASQLLGKNKNPRRQIAAESLENDTNNGNNTISKPKLYQ